MGTGYPIASTMAILKNSTQSGQFIKSFIFFTRLRIYGEPYRSSKNRNKSAIVFISLISLFFEKNEQILILLRILFNCCNYRFNIEDSASLGSNALFNSLHGLKTGSWCSGITNNFPEGAWKWRTARFFKTKLPNPRRVTLSPLDNVHLIHSISCSIINLAADLSIPVLCDIVSTICVLIIIYYLFRVDFRNPVVKMI